mgnify:CR=1 FL=1
MEINHECREEKVMATGGDRGKPTMTLLDFNLVKMRKFDEKKMRMVKG